MTRDYSLLRPFDLEKAKAGEAICYRIDGYQRKFIHGPTSRGEYVVLDNDDIYISIHMSP